MLRPDIDPRIPIERQLVDFICNGLVNENIPGQRAKKPTGLYSNIKSTREFGEKVLRESYTPDICQAMDEADNNPICIWQTANAVGKTHAMARVAIADLLRYEKSQVYTFAAPPEDNLKMLLWGQIGDIVMNYRHLFDGMRISLASMHIERSPQSFLTGVTIPQQGSAKQREARFSGKHAPYIRFIGDEVDAVPEEVFTGIESCMSGGEAKLVGSFNPRSEEGPIARMQRQKRAVTTKITAFNHPNVLTGQDIIPGAVTKEVTGRRINIWSRELYDNETFDGKCFVVPECMVGYVAMGHDGIPFPPISPAPRVITDSSLSYMVLAEYPTLAESKLIPSDKVDLCVARWKAFRQYHGGNPPLPIHPRMGLDVADVEGQDKNVATFRYEGYVAPQLVWDGINPHATGKLGADFYTQYWAKEAFVDSNGVGASVPWHMIEKGCNAYRIMVSNKATQRVEEGEFFSVRDQGWWFMAQWIIRNPSAMIPDDEELIEELKLPTYVKLPNGKIKVMKRDTFIEKIKRSPDKASSLMLTFCPIPEDENAPGELGSQNYYG